MHISKVRTAISNSEETCFVAEYTLDRLMSFLIFLGYEKHTAIEKNAYLYLGTRDNITLINLTKTLHYLKNCVNVFNSVLSSYGSFWYVLPEDFEKETIKHLRLSKGYEQRKRVYFWTDRWLAGLLVNYRFVLLSPNVQKVNLKYPQLLVYLRNEKSDIATKDAGRARVGNFRILDTNAEAEYHGHFIPGNEKSNRSVSFYLRVFNNLVLIYHYLKRIRFIKKCVKYVKQKIFEIFTKTSWNQNERLILESLEDQEDRALLKKQQEKERIMAQQPDPRQRYNHKWNSKNSRGFFRNDKNTKKRNFKYSKQQKFVRQPKFKPKN